MDDSHNWRGLLYPGEWAFRFFIGALLVWLVRLEFPEPIAAGVCTYKNPGDMTGSGAITIAKAAKIGIWLSDTGTGDVYADNMGNGSYTLV